MSREEMTDKQNEPESRLPAENQSAEDLQNGAEPVASNTDQSADLNTEPKPALDRRSDAVEPFVPDIARLPDDDDLYGAAKDGKGNGLWKIPTLGWFVLGGLLICGVAAGLKAILYETPVPIEKVREAADVKKVEKIITQQEDESKRIKQILKQMDDCVRGYLKADEIDQKLAYVRHPRRVRPLMEKYYKDHRMLAEQFRQFANYRAIVIDGSSFVIGRVELVDGATRELLMEQLQNGSYRVDWESDVCYQSMDWDQFILSRPTQSLVMRVAAKPDNFYAYEFSEDQYDCFKITASDSEAYVFGYAVKGGDVSIAMRSYFMQTRQMAGEKSEPVTLLLRFPESARSSHCVLIDRVMAPRWIFVHEHEAEVGQKKTKER